jgi:nitrite reductase/ring-hydroxylating ferredoxin subunit
VRDSRHADKALPIPANTSRSVTLEGRELIIASSGGALYLYENRCPHTSETLDPLGGSVSEAAGSLLRCQRHGAEFLATTGECVAGPCLGERLTAVPFTAVDDQIYLD